MKGRLVAVLIAAVATAQAAGAAQPTGAPGPAGGSEAAGTPGSAATLVPGLHETALRVQQTYDQTRDLTARFTQESTSAALGRSQRAEGRVTIRKPGKMRWDYEGRSGKPGQVIVSDGKTLWIYNPEDRSVIKSEIGGALERTPLAFLMGLGELTRDFEVGRPPADLALGRPGDVVLELTPKEAIAALQNLYLAVDPERALVTAALIVDPFGNRTRLAFEDIRTNTGVPESRFAFTVPPGVQVVTPPRLQ
ncbi:MAG TPA: outer membrane lipoprotein carrier protein LolA [Thermodesulfobacteriota bacterium]